jgi:hypothetical protein
MCSVSDQCLDVSTIQQWAYPHEAILSFLTQRETCAKESLVWLHEYGTDRKREHMRKLYHSADSCIANPPCDVQGRIKITNGNQTELVDSF